MELGNTHILKLLHNLFLCCYHSIVIIPSKNHDGCHFHSSFIPNHYQFWIITSFMTWFQFPHPMVNTTSHVINTFAFGKNQLSLDLHKCTAPSDALGHGMRGLFAADKSYMQMILHFARYVTGRFVELTDVLATKNK